MPEQNRSCNSKEEGKLFWKANNNVYCTPGHTLIDADFITVPSMLIFLGSDFGSTPAVSATVYRKLKSRLDFWSLPRKSFTSVHLTVIRLTLYPL